IAQNGGGISNYGATTVTGSTVTGNNATYQGGGIYWKNNRPTIDPASTVAGNNAPEGPDIYPY
ncbi:MAG TPA: hypothetical protein VF300_02445, partial [Methanothrix sp.]